MDESKIMTILVMIDKKEQMAKSVLSSEMISKFRSLKEILIQTMILSLNIEKSDYIKEFME